MPTLPKPYCAPWKEPPKKKIGSKTVKGFSYNYPKWREVSTRYRQDHPKCQVQECKRDSAVTDHIIPINKGGAIWHPANWGALCHGHHNRKRAKERTGYVGEYAETKEGFIPINKIDIYAQLRSRTTT